MLAGGLVVGWQLARLLLAAQSYGGLANAAFMQKQIANAHFFADHVLVHSNVLASRILHGSESVVGSEV
jgi:hypothetical protein